MRTVFIGGPGRSGTSFVADCLAAHAEVCGFRNVELKLFTEKNGLLDLWHSLVERYSPNRATVALQQFRKLMEALIVGQFGQPGLASLRPAAEWQAVTDQFCAQLLRDGHPVPAAGSTFSDAARTLVRAISELAAREAGPNRPPALFLEKTPHALLALDFLDRIAPDASFVHVMRDPRSIANSLRAMPWGPDRLETCATWVESYCEAWLATEARAAKLGLTVHLLHIEAIAARSEDNAATLCQALGISAEKSLFGRADLSTLNGWADGISAEDYYLLTNRLAGWVRHFGYRQKPVGIHRLFADTSAKAAPSAAPGCAGAPPGPADGDAV